MPSKFPYIVNKWFYVVICSSGESLVLTGIFGELGGQTKLVDVDTLYRCWVHRNISVLTQNVITFYTKIQGHRSMRVSSIIVH